MYVLTCVCILNSINHTRHWTWSNVVIYKHLLKNPIGSKKKIKLFSDIYIPNIWIWLSYFNILPLIDYINVLSYMFLMGLFLFGQNEQITRNEKCNKRVFHPYISLRFLYLILLISIHFFFLCFVKIMCTSNLIFLIRLTKKFYSEQNEVQSSRVIVNI